MAKVRYQNRSSGPNAFTSGQGAEYTSLRNQATSRLRRQKQKSPARNFTPIDNDAERVLERTGKSSSMPKLGKKKITTPKAPSAPRSTGSSAASSSASGTATRASSPPPVTSPASPSNPSSGLGAAAARRTAKAGGGSGGGGGGKSGGIGGGAGYSPFTTEDDPITGLYTAATRDLERRQQLVDATRLARLQDQQKFDDWMKQQRGSADQSMQAAFQRSAQQAADARAQSYNMINQYATEATRQASGTADLLKQAGAQANEAAFGFQSQGDAVSNAGGAFNQANFAQLQNQQSDVDRARAANMVASYNAQAAQQGQSLQDEGSKLKIQEASSRIDQANKDRQFILDQQAAQFLQGLKQGELGVKQYGAQTDRIVGTLNAKAKMESNRIRGEIAAGTLDLRRADLQLKRKGYNLQRRKQILAEAKQGNANTAQTNKFRQDASTFINKWNTDNLAAQGLPAAPRGDAGIAYARSAIGALKSRWPGLKGTDALDMLRGLLPGDVLGDNRILNEIANNFQ